MYDLAQLRIAHASRSPAQRDHELYFCIPQALQQHALAYHSRRAKDQHFHFEPLFNPARGRVPTVTILAGSALYRSG
jgi:hypothetical protein